MSLRLRIAELGLPPAVRKRGIRELSELCARAFGTPAPDLARLNPEEALSLFARFTCEQAARLQTDDDARRRIERRLREEAIVFGSGLRRALGLRTLAQAMRAARLLYRAVGIDFRPSAAGEILIPACSFAETYTPATCRTIAALDEGLLIGLAGDGELSFSARLTEGHPACRARFDLPETRR
jgi:hypothetical protein